MTSAAYQWPHCCAIPLTSLFGSEGHVTADLLIEHSTDYTFTSGLVHTIDYYFGKMCCGSVAET